MKVKTRFAPSPTGFMHVGGVRTALFAWLLAKQAGGQFVLRIEDTDRERHIEGSEEHIIESLAWLGLNPDEGPYRQSERLAIYKQWADKLIASGRAYADTTTPQQLDGLRQQAKADKKPFLFRDYRPLDPPQWQEGTALRFKSDPKQYNWHDAVMGDLASGLEVIDDFIILKSDGFPTYNFAHIIDDHLMEISHVIRSQEFLPSIPKFLNLYEALGIDPPIMATLPYVLGPDGHKKLSKRDGAKDILDYKRQGYLPAALISFLATLGWNDATEQEVFTIKELVKKFELSKVHRSGASFDDRRLLWVDGQFIRQTQPDDLFIMAEQFWPNSANLASLTDKKAVLALVQERLKYLAELPELTSLFFEEPSIESIMEQYNDPKTKKLIGLSAKQIADLIRSSINELDNSDFSLLDIKTRLNNLLQSQATNPRILFSIIRIAISGQPSSPELFGTLCVLGKDKTVARLKIAASELEK